MGQGISLKSKWKSWIKSWVIYFTAHTINCVCHCIKSMFRILSVYNFGKAYDYKWFQNLWFVNPSYASQTFTLCDILLLSRKGIDEKNEFGKSSSAVMFWIVLIACRYERVYCITFMIYSKKNRLFPWEFFFTRQ